MMKKALTKALKKQIILLKKLENEYSNLEGTTFYDRVEDIQDKLKTLKGHLDKLESKEENTKSALKDKGKAILYSSNTNVTPEETIDLSDVDSLDLDTLFNLATSGVMKTNKVR